MIDLQGEEKRRRTTRIRCTRMEGNITIGSGDIFGTQTSTILLIDQCTFALIRRTTFLTGSRSDVFAEWTGEIFWTQTKSIARLIQDDTCRTVSTR